MLADFILSDPALRASSPLLIHSAKYAKDIKFWLTAQFPRLYFQGCFCSKQSQPKNYASFKDKEKPWPLLVIEEWCLKLSMTQMWHKSTGTERPPNFIGIIYVRGRTKPIPFIAFLLYCCIISSEFLYLWPGNPGSSTLCERVILRLKGRIKKLQILTASTTKLSNRTCRMQLVRPGLFNSLWVWACQLCQNWKGGRVSP